MPSFSGKFQYLNADGSGARAGSCNLSFEAETFTLNPSSGPPLALDLGDIDVFLPGEYELTLTLYTGKKIRLVQFGRTFQNLHHDLLEAYRRRLVQCLLLEDLEEITRFDGSVRLDSPARSFSSPAEFRLYKSNLAVLPTQAAGLQWRLADIDRVSFDESTWAITLESGDQKLIITKLAKRTEEFRDRLATASEELAVRSAGSVHSMFPFLDPDAFQRAAELMKEGHAASLARLRAIHTSTEQAILSNTIDEKLKPYFDALRAQVPGGNYYAGFKLLRQSEEAADSGNAAEESDGAPTLGSARAGVAPTLRSASAGLKAGATKEAESPSSVAEDEDAAAKGGDEPPILHWFFMPLAAQAGAKSAGNLVAWEATSRSGRATYFFRLVAPELAGQLRDPSRGPALIESAIQQLNRAIVLLNFRREPIYLPEESLMMQPRFRRYAIACRKLPELVRLRSSFLGRAIHTSPDAWQKQFQAYLAKA